MKSVIVAMTSLLIFTFAADAVDIVVPTESDGTAKVRTYQGEWKMLGKQGDSWQHTGVINESLAKNSKEQWVHIQTQSAVVPSGPKSTTQRHLRPTDLFVHKMDLNISNGAKGQPSQVAVDFADKAATRKLTFPDGKEMDDQPATTLAFNGFDGFILGLVLSNFDLETGKVFRLPVVMPTNFSQYWVDAEVKEAEPVEIAGEMQQLWQVDTEWLDIKTGATNAAGPDQSGGSYFIFKNPQSEQPAVYRYKNNSVDIVLQ